MKNSNPTTTKKFNPKSADEAFAAVRGEIEAVATEDLVPINFDVATACTIALGAADRMDAIAEELLALPGFDAKSLRKLRTYAHAALYANAVGTAPVPNDAVAKVLEEAVPLRENMLVAAEALAHRGVLSASRVAEIRSGQGHLDTADDLVALAAVFRESWKEVSGKTTVTAEEVDRAAVLGSQLHVALGVRRVGSDAGVGARDLVRERAVSLFVRAYDECRRGVGYVRWHHGDARGFAPSLFGRRRRGEAGEVDAGSEVVVDVGGTVEPVEPVEPVVGS